MDTILRHENDDVHDKDIILGKTTNRTARATGEEIHLDGIKVCHVVQSSVMPNSVKKMTHGKVETLSRSRTRRSNQEISFSLTIICLVIFPLILYDEVGHCAPTHRHHHLSSSVVC